METPLISTVVTVYNLEGKIGRCLETLSRQSYRNLEIIVVDDASTDDSLAEIADVKDGRVTLICQPNNMGAGQARRTGIEAAKGEYIITIDGDDWIDEDFIEILAKNAIETGADIVSGGLTAVYGDGYEEVKRFKARESSGIQKFLDYNNQRIIFLNNKLVRRSLYDLVPYCTRRYCEDTPVILPLLYHANKVSYCETSGYYYLQHQASLCHKVSPFENALFKALCCQDCREFFADKGKEYSGMIGDAELVNHIRDIKKNMTPESARTYRQELGELMPSILRLVSM